MRLGAAHVTVAYRRTRDQMPAYAFEVDEAEDEGVGFEWLAAPVEVLGAGRVQRVLFDRMQARRSRDSNGRTSARADRRASSRCAQTRSSQRSGRPRSRSCANGRPRRMSAARIASTRDGRASACPTSIAGGDAVNGGASVVQAVAEGKRAARAIEEALCPS